MSFDLLKHNLLRAHWVFTFLLCLHCSGSLQSQKIPKTSQSGRSAELANGSAVANSSNATEAESQNQGKNQNTENPSTSGDCRIGLALDNPTPCPDQKGGNRTEDSGYVGGFIPVPIDGVNKCEVDCPPLPPLEKVVWSIAPNGPCGSSGCTADWIADRMARTNSPYSIGHSELGTTFSVVLDQYQKGLKVPQYGPDGPGAEDVSGDWFQYKFLVFASCLDLPGGVLVFRVPALITPGTIDNVTGTLSDENLARLKTCRRDPQVPKNYVLTLFNQCMGSPDPSKRHCQEW